jgi:hypothetical protein
MLCGPHSLGGRDDLRPLEALLLGCMPLLLGMGRTWWVLVVVQELVHLELYQ